jgi:hypothetical protein
MCGLDQMGSRHGNAGIARAAPVDRCARRRGVGGWSRPQSGRPRHDKEPADRIAVLLALCLVGIATAGAAAADDRPSRRDVLRRAGDYVAAYFEQLPRLVATETTTQRATRADDAGDNGVIRRLRAEFGWYPLPDEFHVMGCRDVVEVNGLPVTADRQRLATLLHGGRATANEVRVTLEESARYNLVPGSRNFNLPTAAMHFLHPDMQPRFSWKRRSSREAAVWELEYREKRRPTIVRTGEGRAVPSRGRVRIDARTGAVIRTVLELKIDEQGVTYWLAVDFSPVDQLELRLPSTMMERFDSGDVTVIGRASYSNYRQFATSARIVG